MRRSVSRSARTGRFVKASTASRSPKTTVTQSVPSGASGGHHRSAITGRYIGAAAAARHPNTSISEGS